MTSGEIGRLTEETIRLSTQLTETTWRLMIAVQYAWLDGLAQSYHQSSLDVEQMLEQQARTSRLVSQGVPPEIAARGLHLV